MDKYNLNVIYNRNIQNIIGVNNDLLVGIKDDFRWFKEHTINNIVVMGYNTFLTLPGKKSINPLRNRLNIIISKNHYDTLIELVKNSEDPLDVIVYKSFDEFYIQWFPCKANHYQTLFMKNNENTQSILTKYKDIRDFFIIGGSKLYNYIFDNYHIDTIYETISNIKIDTSEYIRDGNKITYFRREIKDHFLKTYSGDLLTDKIELNGGLKYGRINKENIGYNFNIYQHRENVNLQEFQYLKLLKDIYKEGVKRDSRNSSVLSVFSPHPMRFDLREGLPLLTSKKVQWKTVLKELLWFISGSTDNKVLNKNKVTIWNGNSSKEYMERIGLSHYKEGDLGPIYGFQWRHFGAKYIDCDNDYKGEGIDQLSYIINEIKNNPTSRRIILSSWNPMDINKMALPPCHVMVQFYVDTKNKYLDAKLIQRSGDMFLGIPFNIASYSILMHIIGNLTGYIPRYFIHDIGDAHIYDKHRSAIDIQLKRKTFNFPQLIIKRNFKDIDDINDEYF